MLSIVIPLYNKEHVISKTIDSILSQKCDFSFEIIVVDDGSTDDSCRVIESYNNTYIKLYKKNNGGPSSARNYGIAKATGDWIVTMDADDTFVEGAFKIFENVINSHPGFLCYCFSFDLLINNRIRKFSHFYTNGTLSHPFRNFAFQNFYPRSGTFVIHRQIKMNYQFPEQMRRYEDLAYYFNIMKNERIYSSNKVVMYYNQDTLAACFLKGDIKKDYLGYLNPHDCSFWELVVMYGFYIEAKRKYPNECTILYKKKDFSKKIIILTYNFIKFTLFIRRVLGKIYFELSYLKNNRM